MEARAVPWGMRGAPLPSAGSRPGPAAGLGPAWVSAGRGLPSWARGLPFSAADCVLLWA